MRVNSSINPKTALPRNRALTWRRAAAIAWRDLKSAPGKFAFVILSVAIGVAALVGVRGFAEAFRSTLGIEARSLMAGDLSARIFRLPTPADLKSIAALEQKIPGMRSSWITETVSMASVPSDPVPLLVALKAVDPAQYPYYGAVELEPAMPLAQALAGNNVAVADEFLIRLSAHVGDDLRLGDNTFHIAAMITAGARSPLRRRRHRSARSHLAPGNSTHPTSSRPAAAPLSASSSSCLTSCPKVSLLESLRKDFEQALPDAQVMDYREGNPALTEGLDHATALLSLICLVAMVLGAIGVAMAMHAHLEQRMDVLAILKAVGAGSSDLLRIFLLQTLGLGLAGGLLGVAAGLAVMESLPAVFGNLLPVHTVLAFPWRSIGAGLGTGLLTTLLFCLPPLLDVRAVRPVLVLRRLVESSPDTIAGFFARLWARRLQLSLAIVVVAGLGGIAWALSDSRVVGTWFAAGLASALLVLLALAFVTLRVLRFLLNRVRLRLPSFLRHGLANLYRPGNQSAAVLAALGTGVMLILAVYLMQSAILRDIRETASPKVPNMFLVDITTEESAPLATFFNHLPGVIEPLDLMPSVRGRITALNGKTLDQLKDQHLPRRMLERSQPDLG